MAESPSFRRRSPQKQTIPHHSMSTELVDYTEVRTTESPSGSPSISRSPRSTTMGTDNYVEHQRGGPGESSFPSSFPKRHGGIKTLFPWIRSYMFRRRLSFAAIGAAFLIVGASVTFIMMKQHDNLSFDVQKIILEDGGSIQHPNT
ncbi:hypothetical protein ACHAXS_001983 [Conticribra weissflogii]